MALKAHHRPAIFPERATEQSRGLTPPAISGCLGEPVLQRETAPAISMICGSTTPAPKLGFGSAAQMKWPPHRFMELRIRQRMAMCREHAKTPSLGPTLWAISGCLGGMVLTQRITPAA